MRITSGRMDPVEYADVLAKIGRRFNDALIVLSAASAPVLPNDFPFPVTEMIAKAMGAAPPVPGSLLGGMKVLDSLRAGVAILTHMDASAVKADRIGVTGPVVIFGAIDVTKPEFTFYGMLASVPTIPGFALPQGFSVTSPRLLLSLKRLGPIPVFQIGVGMNMTVPITPSASDLLTFAGDVVLATNGSLSFTGQMITDWVRPLGLDSVTLKAPVGVSMGVKADASVDIGFEAGAQVVARLAVALDVVRGRGGDVHPRRPERANPALLG